MVRFFFILLICFLCQATTLRSQPALDSLKRALKDAKNDSDRADVLNSLSAYIYDTDVNEGFRYASQANHLARNAHYDNGQKRALTLMGYKFTVSGQFQTALRFYKQAQNVNEEEDSQLAYSFVMTGNVYRSIAQYDSALLLYQRALNVLDKNSNDVYLAYTYKSMARLFVIQWKNAEAEEYFKKAMEIYERRNDERGKAEVWFAFADVYKNQNRYDLVNENLEKGCALANKAKSEYLMLFCYKSQGDVFYRRGEYLKSLEVLFKALEILKIKEQPPLLASVYNQLGEIYEELGQHDVALKYYLEALRIMEPSGVKYEVAKLYSEIGWIYKNQLNYAQAHAYMDKSLKMREEIHDDHGISNSYNVLGVLYYQEKKYDKALELLQKSLAIRERIHHEEGVSACIFNIALVYEAQGQYDRALAYQLRALVIDEKAGNKQGLSISYNQVGQLYGKAGRYKEAEEYLEKARVLATSTGSKILLMNNLLYFSVLFESRKDYKKALDYQKRYQQMHDSVYSESNALKLAEMQALYQTEQKNQEIAFLNQHKENQNSKIELQRSHIEQQNIIIFSGLAGVILISILAYKSYQYATRIRKANFEMVEKKEEIMAQSEELIEANQTIAQINRTLEGKIEERTSALRQAYKELDTFFYRSSHDFRRPLTTFMGLAEVAKITVKDTNALELFAKVKETASNLDKMLVKLQSISDVGAQQLVYKEVFIKEIVNNVCDSFSEELRGRGIHVQTDAELKQSFFSYPAMVKIIVENLIENAIFFSGLDQPFIYVRAFDEGGEVVLEVEDNGQGIEKQYEERIFEMYFRGNERSKGNGLGLYIVKKAVEKLNGKIEVRSGWGQGSVFRVTFPTDQQHADILS
ncbi:tetratricopeptide repeat protein [Chryseolinea soli]|uniref:histidine kinase n=1 Tax=Chryseolinea soli TaxID=2321403 RepID=A0A385SS65_9BACT|nr:tetratricopeptide repeat protein [Chryseolinea soli]AYB32815.1 tetratricopeptide repeat protein [Chryseolinea soli]